jgi:membrane-associated phospholipid phosphatase
MSKEIAILDFIQKHTRSRQMDRLMTAVSKANNYGAVWLSTSIALAAIPKTRKTGLGMFASLGVEFTLCNIILKPLGDRIRPYDKAEDENHIKEHLLIDEPWDQSFPSGHTGASFAIASSLFFNHNIAWKPVGVIACTTGFSRMYLYVHYLTDVLGGVGVGIFSGYAGTKLVNSIYDHKARREGRTNKEK